MPNAWLSHVKTVYAKGKSKGMTYSAALKAAAKTYSKSSKAAKPKGKKGKGKKKKKSKN